MRPIRLTMTAFGPYKDQVTVDFRQLREHRLFVISGRTGAGKTTIFDAICYALYGSASGEDRDDPRMLRSHFASDDTYTSVDLLFQIGQKKYRVFRQMPHIKEGNKTETGGKIELYEQTESGEKKAVDRFAIRDVNEKLQQLIGLTRDQFIQIVMLPQGEFRKLLTSETENKEEILRRIFKTNFYQKMSEVFQQKHREIQTQLQQKQTEQEMTLAQIGRIVPEREGSLLSTLYDSPHHLDSWIHALNEEAAYYEQELADHRNKLDELRQSLAKVERELAEANRWNEVLLQRDEWKQQLLQMDEEQEHIYEMERVWKRAERASAIRPYYDQRIQLQEDIERKKQALTVAQTNLSAIKERWLQTVGRYETEKANEQHRLAWARTVERMEERLPIVKGWAERQKVIAELQKTVDTERDRLKRGALKAERLQKEKEELENQIDEWQKTIESLPQLIEQRNAKNLKLRTLNELLETLTQLQRSLREQQAQEQKYIQLKEQYEMIEEQWKHGQAALLAIHLEEGQPCPVCGSTTHPNIVEKKDSIITQEELDRWKRELQEAEKAYVYAQSEVASTQTSQQRLFLDLHELGMQLPAISTESPEMFDPAFDVLNEQMAFIKKAVRELDQQIEHIQQRQSQLHEMRAQRSEREQQLQRWAEFKEEVEKTIYESEMRLNSEQLLLQREQEQVPEDERDSDLLQKRIAKAKKKLADLQQSWLEAEQAYEREKQLLTRAEADCEHAEKQLEEAVARNVVHEQKWEEWLEQAGFTNTEDFEQAMMDDDEWQRLRQKTESFHEQYRLLSHQLEQAEKTIGDRTFVDVTELEQNVKTTQDEWELQQKRVHDMERLLKDIRFYIEKLKELVQQLEKLEAEWSLHEDLFQTFKGNNPLKVSFERYILIEYLEQILQSANERLRKLSQGQFVLQRSNRLERHNRQSGLGLDVYDVYTGMTRDVKTLSGGEKFNTSLCLALGLADVIQAHQGGISIEMMFIDEGFGSLDDESLQQALDTLIELQHSGRMIGVISHVTEIKQALPAVLEVSKNKSGHSSLTWQVK